MQGVKEKLQDMSAMRKAKADAKAEEKAEKELAKTRVDIAHEIRLAREAEATMDLHVNKVGEKIEREIAKHSTQQHPNASAKANTSPTATAAGTGTGTGYRTDTAGDPIPITNTAPTNTYDAPGTNKWI